MTSRRALHAWARRLSGDRWRASCGAELGKDRAYAMLHDGEDPTCLPCLRSMRDHHLGRARYATEQGHRYSQAVEAEVRKRSRRGK